MKQFKEFESHKLEGILYDLKYRKSVIEAKNSLYEFFKQAWHIMEGDTPFIDNWHIKVIAEHLEACYRREIKNLLINVPPRTGKSSLISVAFPVWVWLQNPEEKFMYASYAHSLSTEHALKSKRLIMSDWFLSRWGHIYQIAKDKSAVVTFENNKKGCRISTSVDAVNTGKGGNILVCDDPNSASDGNSEAYRRRVNQWWDQVWSTRLNNPKNDVRIVVQQRIHEKDLSGHIIASDINNEWVKLIIPMEFEEKRKAKTVILPSTNGKIWEDPRTKDGELLSDSRFSIKEINRYKQDLGSYGFAGQYQQRPSPLTGGILQRDWFKKYQSPYLPRFNYIIQSWDTAISDSSTAAYSACTTWGAWCENIEEGLYKVILLSMWRGRVGYPELRDRAKRLAKDYKDIGVNNNLLPAQSRIDCCLIEAKATGDPLVRDLRLAGVPAIGYQPKGDKTSRVQRVAASIECGLVYLPTEEKSKDKLVPFADEFLESVITFPNSDSRDLVDTMTQALSYLKDNDILPHPSDEREKESEPLYTSRY
jgi:predicted phage terminase large subunit-like protein